mgnify:CR=1 FL=1
MAMVSPSSRKGAAGEQTAVEHLLGEGYTVLERNFRVRGGEIDVVALDGEVLCFVEVRTRQNADHGEPVETVGRAKQRRLVTAARHYLGRHEQDREIRFDVIGIVLEPEPRIQLVRGAFEPGWAC